MNRSAPLVILSAVLLAAVIWIVLGAPGWRAPESPGQAATPGPSPSSTMAAANENAAAGSNAPPSASPASPGGEPRREVAAAFAVRGSFVAPSGVWPGGGEVELHPAPRSGLGLFDLQGEAMQGGGPSGELPEGMAAWLGRTEPAAHGAVRPDGSFEIMQPPVGRWRLRLDHPHLREAKSLELEVEDGTSVDLGALPTVLAGSLLVLVNDQQGQPIEGARVLLGTDFDLAQFTNPSAMDHLGEAMREMIPRDGRTDARGVHRFQGLLQRRWRLAVRSNGWVDQAREVAVVPGADEIVRVEMGHGATLRAHVLGPDGSPHPGARLQVRSPERDPSAAFGRTVRARFEGEGISGETDQDGVATITGLPPVRAEVALRTPGFSEDAQTVTLHEEQPTELTFRLQRGVTIAGVVLDDQKQPIEGAHVANPAFLGQQVMGMDVGGFVGEGALAVIARREGVATDADGRFELGGFHDGDEAELVAVADGFQPTRQSKVAAGSTGVELVLQPTAHLTGTVLHDDDTPVDDFEVRLRERAWLVMERTARSEHFTGAADGRFRLDAAPRGTFEVEISAGDGSRWQGHVDLSTGEADLGVVHLEPPGAIAGTVLDEGGAPVEHAAVRIAKGGFLDALALSAMVGTDIQRTAADGGFRIDGVSPGRVRLLVDAPDLAPLQSDAIEVKSGETTSGVVLHLDRGGSVHGRVIDEAERPEVGWTVQVQTPDGRSTKTAVTAADGSFRVTGLAPGSHEVQAIPTDYMKRFAQSAPGFDPERGKMDMSGLMDAALRWTVRDRVVVRAGEDVEVELVFEGGSGPDTARVRVSGTVSVGGQPLASGSVMLAEAGSATPSRVVPVRDGHFDVDDLTPGAWRVDVHKGVFTASLGSPHVVQIPAEKRYELRLDLPGGSIRGRVRRPDGSGAGRVIVTLSGGDAAFDTLDHPELEGATITDADGAFAFDGLDAGTYDVVAKDLAAGPGTAAVGRAEHLLLSEGTELTDIDVTLEPGGTVRVAVRDDQGPRSNALVTPLRDDGMPLELLHRRLTDADGVVELDGLPPGRYRMLVEAPKAAPFVSGVLEVAAGTTADVDARLSDGVEVTVTIDDALGLKGQTVSYSLWTAAGVLQRQGRVLIGDGPLSLGRLQPGAYRLWAAAAAGAWQVQGEVDEHGGVWHLP